MALKLEVLTDNTANLGMHNCIGSGRVRHQDVNWTQEAVQAGRFSLKKVGTNNTVSDLTTKHHDEERLKVLMTLERLRYTRGHGDAVLERKLRPDNRGEHGAKITAHVLDKNVL